MNMHFESGAMRITYLLFILLTSWHGAPFGATLSGSVQDESTTLADVEVMLVDAKNGVILNRAYTDESGKFSFAVSAGSYHIGAFRPEFAKVWQKKITIKDTDISVRIEMEPKAFSDDSSSDESSSDDCE
jgi:hypothetical protein